MAIYRSYVYEKFAPFVARIFIASLFLFAAYGQIPGTSNFAFQVKLAAAYGVPVASLAVTLAFVLEIVTAIMLIIGYKARLAAALLAPYTLLLAVIFYGNISDPKILGSFVSHLGLIGGLLYVSVYGAHTFAVKKDN